MYASKRHLIAYVNWENFINMCSWYAMYSEVCVAKRCGLLGRSTASSCVIVQLAPIWKMELWETAGLSVRIYSLPIHYNFMCWCQQCTLCSRQLWLWRPPLLLLLYFWFVFFLFAFASSFSSIDYFHFASSIALSANDTSFTVSVDSFQAFEFLPVPITQLLHFI